MYLIALTLVQSHRVAFFSAIVLSTNYLFVINAVYAEVYLPQLFFFLLALQFVLLQKAIPAGAAFALSFLVTPSALFGLPCLLLMQRDKRAIAHLTITAFIIVMIALFPNLNDYFSGGRGLIKAVSSNLTIKDALVKEGREISMSLAWYAPLFLAGGVSLMNNNRLHRFGVALFSLWFFSFIFGEKFADVPVQLPAYALLSLVIGLGSNYLLTVSTKRNRLLFSTVFLFIMLCISITGFISFRRTAETTCNLNQYRDSALEINRQSHPEYLVVGDWSKGILFEHYVFQQSYTGVWINTEWLYGDWGDRIQEDSRKKFKEAIASGREIWFLGNEFSLFSELYHHGYHIELFKNFYRATVPTPKD
jgi:hypothetical protein